MLTVNRNNLEKWDLLFQVLSGEISETDSSFQAWLQENDDNRILLQSLKNGTPVGNYKPNKDEMFRKIASTLSFKSQKPAFYKRMWPNYTAALFVFSVLGVIAYLTINNKWSPKHETATSKYNNVFAPGSKNAFLFSSQGDTIDLTADFEMKKKDGTVIHNDKKGVVSVEQRNQERESSIENHTIYVPRGGEYTLVLSDGTTVHLNSDTQLTFPSFFGENGRMVQLTGEAYFEVQKQTTPFVVQTGEMQVKVLGTSFNVNAYKHNSYTNATLVDGSVEIYTSGTTEPRALNPGENLNFEKSSQQISIAKVNPDHYTAWVRGIFIFRNQPLSDIFAQLQRWYNFDVVYENPRISSMRFTGSAEKAHPLNYLLDQIQMVTDVKYKSNGNMIVLY